MRVIEKFIDGKKYRVCDYIQEKKLFDLKFGVDFQNRMIGTLFEQLKYIKDWCLVQNPVSKDYVQIQEIIHTPNGDIQIKMADNDEYIDFLDFVETYSVYEDISEFENLIKDIAEKFDETKRDPNKKLTITRMGDGEKFKIVRISDNKYYNEIGKSLSPLDVYLNYRDPEVSSISLRSKIASAIPEGVKKLWRRYTTEKGGRKRKTRKQKKTRKRHR